MGANLFFISYQLTAYGSKTRMQSAQRDRKVITYDTLTALVHLCVLLCYGANS